MRIWRILALAIGLASAFSAARAQEPSAEAIAVAEEFFSIVFDGAVGQLNAQAVDYTWPGIEQALRARNPNIETAMVAGLRGEFERIRLGRMRSLMKDMPITYARHLTQEDMRNAIAFYRTPTGQRILHVVPRVLTEGFGSVLPLLPGAAAETHEAFLKLLRERGLLQ
jgi:hypothetical protein